MRLSVSSQSEKEYLEDLIEACEWILHYTDDMTFEDFSEDRRTIDAVLRNIIVVGEAVNKLPTAFTEENPRIPWHSMRGLRNFVVHEYRSIDLPRLWETVQNDIPSILPELKRLCTDPTL